MKLAMAVLNDARASGDVALENFIRTTVNPVIEARRAITAPTAGHNLLESIVESITTDPAKIATASAISLIFNTKVFCVGKK